MFWSPNWDPTETTVPGARLLEVAAIVRPVLVIVDPLRVFWPLAELKPDEAIEMIRQLRRLKCCALVTHHRRKPSVDRPVNLESEPHGWFLEAAGSHALVNNTDTRLGVEPARSNHQAELLLGGFIRSIGPLPSQFLAREYDDSGVALGYTAMAGIDLLGENHRRAWLELPDTFGFSNAKRALAGNSDSNTARFLRQCVSLGVARREGTRYVKVPPQGGGVGGAPEVEPLFAGPKPLHPPMEHVGEPVLLCAP